VANQAHIDRLETLEQFRTTLSRSVHQLRDSLQSVSREIEGGGQWIVSEERQAVSEVKRSEERVRRADAALKACRARAYRDEDGYWHYPDCSSEEYDAQATRRELVRNESRLREVRQWRQRIEKAIAPFRREMAALNNVLVDQVSKGQATLSQAISVGREYTRGGAAQGAHSQRLGFGYAGNADTWGKHTIRQTDALAASLRDVAELKQDRWSQATPEEREKALRRVAELASAALGIPSAKIVFEHMESRGQWDGQAVVVNRRYLESHADKDWYAKPRNAVATTVHEVRHAYQDYVVAHSEAFPEHIQIEMWAEQDTPDGYVESPREHYEGQPVEADTIDFAERVLKELDAIWPGWSS
jgi:hypothetical protein